MGQVFIAREKFQFNNGAIGYRPGGPFDCLGPFAKINNCPVNGYDRTYTVYATGYADSYFSIPGCTRIKGKHVKGVVLCENNSPVFHPYTKS